MDLANEHLALGLLREARVALVQAKSINPTRELAVAMTECDTAILWLRHDLGIKQSGTKTDSP